MSCHSVTRGTSDWSEAELRTLRRLWAEGMTALAIGRELGRTRNSVVGKAHRLLLPPRPSPIGRKRGDPLLPATPRVVAPRPSRSAPPPPKMAPPVKLSPVKLAPAQIAAMGRRPPAPPPPAPPEPPQAPETGQGTCQWPVSEDRPWRFCGAPVEAVGRPYCAQHAAIAWHRPPRRLEAA